jgi:hypothetical protein
METIYIIIETIGDLNTIVDKAYFYYTDAFNKAKELEFESHSKGYIDFKYSVKELEIIGLK